VVFKAPTKSTFTLGLHYITTMHGRHRLEVNNQNAPPHGSRGGASHNIIWKLAMVDNWQHASHHHSHTKTERQGVTTALPPLSNVETTKTKFCIFVPAIFPWYADCSPNFQSHCPHICQTCIVHRPNLCNIAMESTLALCRSKSRSH